MPPTKARAKKKLTSAPVSVAELTAQSAATEESHYRAKKTKQTYDGHLKRARAWAASLPEVTRVGLDLDELSEATPLALRLYLTFKMDNQKLRWWMGWSDGESVCRSQGSSMLSDVL